METVSGDIDTSADANENQSDIDEDTIGDFVIQISTEIQF